MSLLHTLSEEDQRIHHTLQYEEVVLPIVDRDGTQLSYDLRRFELLHPDVALSLHRSPELPPHLAKDDLWWSCYFRGGGAAVLAKGRGATPARAFYAACALYEENFDD